MTASPLVDGTSPQAVDGPTSMVHSARSQLFELSQDLLATIDSSGCFVDVNPAWERTLGWPTENLIGRRAVELLHPDDLRRTRATGESYRADNFERLVEFENRYRCADGDYRWL